MFCASNQKCPNIIMSIRAICVICRKWLFFYLSSVSARVSGLKYIILLCRAYLQEGVNYVSIALEKLLILYEPMIYKYSCVKGKYSEDLHQWLLLDIALNIHKFPI